MKKPWKIPRSFGKRYILLVIFYQYISATFLQPAQMNTFLGLNLHVMVREHLHEMVRLVILIPKSCRAKPDKNLLNGSVQQSFKTQRRFFQATITGSGSVTVAGVANGVQAGAHGSGGLQAVNLQAKSVNALISGSGSAVISVERDLMGSVSGAGSIQYRGNPHVSVQTSGVGRVSPINGWSPVAPRVICRC